MVIARPLPSPQQAPFANDTDDAGRNAQPSWRKVVPPHQLAEMPPLPPEDLKSLADDIREHGIRNEVTIYRDEHGLFVLDGCNRLDAAELADRPIIKNGMLNLDAVPVRWVAGNIDLKKFVRAQNLLRRHLTAEQKRHWAEKLLKFDPSRSDRAIARDIGIDHKTLGAERRRLEACGEIPHTDTRTDGGGRQQPAHRPKAGNGVSRQCHGLSVNDHRDDDDGGQKHTEPASQAAAPTNDPIATIHKSLAALSGEALIEVLRPHIQRLGREGLCRVIPDKLKADLSDHVIGQALQTASLRSSFARDSTRRLHALLRCAEEPTTENTGKMIGAAKAILRDAQKHDITRSNILIAEGGAKTKKNKWK
jgi:hypothetical protein